MVASSESRNWMPRLLWDRPWLNLHDVFIFENKEALDTYLKLQQPTAEKEKSPDRAWLWSAYVHAFEFIMESQSQGISELEGTSALLSFNSFFLQMGKLRPRKGQDLLMSDPELPRHSLLKWSLVRQTDFESWLCRLFSGWPWPRDVTFLSLSFLTYKMGIIIPSLKGCCKD